MKIRTIIEHVITAEELAKENNGILPNIGWLLRNDYYGLLHAMRRHPDKFSHIKQDKKYGNAKRWVIVAQKLARENNGVLPNSQWLKVNGYSKTYSAMKKYPEKFSHIKQKRMTRTPDEWIIIAEKLAEKNNGILMGPKLLIKNGYSGLVRMINMYPNKFSHVRRI
jgi:hypothetical protein